MATLVSDACPKCGCPKEGDEVSCPYCYTNSSGSEAEAKARSTTTETWFLIATSALLALGAALWCSDHFGSTNFIQSLHILMTAGT